VVSELTLKAGANESDNSDAPARAGMWNSSHSARVRSPRGISHTHMPSCEANWMP